MAKDLIQSRRGKQRVEQRLLRARRVWALVAQHGVHATKRLENLEEGELLQPSPNLVERRF
ncbi:hypothetical protein [Gemmatimonas sp.]|uniref:hypothetical protein n=1 Tax=Gemmatimonas sp. TaxID=1962908 RepID=UPI0033410F50